MSAQAPLVLFGAFDRHNFGDLLLAHIAAAECGRDAIFAGLARRDLSACGGFAVAPLTEVAAGWRGRHGAAPLELLHVGGELLDCDIAQAAHMLGEPALELGRRCAYAVAKRELPPGAVVRFRAVGGAALAARDAAFRAEVCATLAQADAVSVRDRETQAFLAANGIAAALEPDPATRVAALFGGRIAAARTGVAAPYVALQFAAECGDDATLDAFAQGAARLAGGIDIVLFRAGAAPWHDDLEPYRRLAARLGPRCRVFESLDLWKICALIAGARAVAATSLHARLVAEACRVPAVSLERAPGAGRKLRAYLATWQPQARVLAPQEFAAA